MPNDHYIWSARNTDGTEVAEVNNTGYVTTKRVGEVRIIVEERNGELILTFFNPLTITEAGKPDDSGSKAEAALYVIEPSQMLMHITPISSATIPPGIRMLMFLYS